MFLKNIKKEYKKIDQKKIEPWNFFYQLKLELKNDSNIWDEFFWDKRIFLYLNSNVKKHEKNINFFHEREGYFLFDTAIYKEEIQTVNKQKIHDSLNYQKLKEDKKIFEKIKINLEIILDSFKFNDKYLFKNQKIESIDNSKNFLEKKIKEIKNIIQLIEEEKIKILKKYNFKDVEEEKSEKWQNFKIIGISEMIKKLSKKRNIEKKYFNFDQSFSMKRNNFIKEKEKEKLELERRMNFKFNFFSIETSKKLTENALEVTKNNKWYLFVTSIIALTSICSTFIVVYDLPNTSFERKKFLLTLFISLFLSVFVCFFVFPIIKKYLWPKFKKWKNNKEKSVNNKKNK